MENPRSQVKVAMSFGAMYGLANAAVALIFYFIGTDIQSKAPQLLGYTALILSIILGIKSYRDTELGGFISFGKSVGTGLLISIFGGMIIGAFTVLLFTYIAPEMMQLIINATEEKLAQQSMSEDQMQIALGYTRKMMTPIPLFIFSIIGSAIAGLIFSLLISVFMKKEQNPFNTNVG